MGSIAAANVGLAGCGGQQNQPSPIQGEDPGTDDASTLHTRVQWGWAAGDTNLNRWAAVGNYPNDQSSVFYPHMVTYSPTEQRFVYQLADGPPEMKGCEQHVTLKDTYNWWDGTTVTAEDYVVLGRIAPYFCCGGPDQVSWEPHLVDDFTYYEQKPGKYNQGFNNSNLTKGFFVRRDIYRPYLERFQDATTDEEIQNISKELTNLNITLDEMMERGFGYGLWKPVDYTSSSITLEKHDGHPAADRTDLERWEWHIIPNNQSFYQAFKQDRFDYGWFKYQQNVQQPPSGIEQIFEYAGQRGRKLGMSWRNEHLARRPVRRAIGYLIDRQALETIVGGVSAMTQQTAGMPDRLVRKWVGSDFLDSIIDYGVEARPEQAAETLRAAGYEKRNGVWQDSDGKRMRGLRFISLTGGNEALIGDTLSAQLNDFGIKNDFTTLESGSYRNAVDPGTGTHDFDFVLHEAGTGSPHPSIVWKMTSARVVDAMRKTVSIRATDECNIESASYEFNKEKTPLFKIPVNPSPPVPETVGATEIDGDGRDIEPIKTSNRMRYKLPEDEIKSMARDWAWWVNFNLFHVYLHSFDRQMWLDAENFSLKEDSVIRGANLGSGPMANGDIVTK
jgi:ABC-type transport system substrate-binding protein